LEVSQVRSDCPKDSLNSPASGGTTPVVRGTGFENRPMVNFESGEVQEASDYADTFNVTTPVLLTRPIRIMVINANDRQYSLDVDLLVQ
jgi:hypothetical protein